MRMKHSIADYFITENEEGEETHFEKEASKTLAESQRFSFILNETLCGPKLKPTQLLVYAEHEHNKLPTLRSHNCPIMSSTTLWGLEAKLCCNQCGPF